MADDAICLPLSLCASVQMQALDEQFPGFELEIQGIDKVRQTRFVIMKHVKGDQGIAYLYMEDFEPDIEES